MAAKTVKNIKIKKIQAKILQEIKFLKGIFSVISVPSHLKGEDSYDFEMTKGTGSQDSAEVLTKRASNVAELEEKLQKIKSTTNYNLKSKLMKKSLNSKLKKKLKKNERTNKVSVKPNVDGDLVNGAAEEKIKVKPNVAKPIFNNEGKLVFSKFDFANIGKKDKPLKAARDPKKILEDMKKQTEKLKEIEQKEDSSKVVEIKEKMAWKNILQKAEGQKIKDDPILLKKSIKKMEQKKKKSKKQWDNRIQTVQQKKEDKQKKRQENISKKKKEKKSKVIKAATKRGRVVI